MAMGAAMAETEAEQTAPSVSFDCACGRSQAYAPAHHPGGITEEEAAAIGWRREQGRWLCPFCGGPG